VELDQLGIFAKYWEPGKVKTRLAARVGAQVAADLYASFLTVVIENSARAFPGHRVLAYAPPERRGAFHDLVDDRWQLEPQANGDLGQRIQYYFTSAFAGGYQHVVLTGSDSPNLPRAYIRQAFQNLRHAQVVLGPSDDGGYYLIGARLETPDIFAEIPWSTGEVFARTVEKLRRAGMTWHQLPVWYDVDEVADLRRLRMELAAQDEPSPVVATLINQIDEALSC
jgi:rSAM/selenodomain-associated transferase 1